MTLNAGAKLRSTVCDTECIVIRLPSEEGIVNCGGKPMMDAKQVVIATDERINEPDPHHALIGKRYVDELSGIELLCTKQGWGALDFDGRSMTLKQAKTLPSSD